MVGEVAGEDCTGLMAKAKFKLYLKKRLLIGIALGNFLNILISVRHEEGSVCLAAHNERKGGVVIFCCYCYCFLGSSHKEMLCGFQKSLSANASCHE